MIHEDERRLLELAIAAPLTGYGQLAPYQCDEWWSVARALPERRLLYILRKWGQRFGIWETGVSERCGWFDDGAGARASMVAFLASEVYGECEHGYRAFCGSLAAAMFVRAALAGERREAETLGKA
jgi:hypothetical protein